jgi:hypothetical protein
MTAYLGYHDGLLQGGIFAALAALVILIGIVTYRRWVSRSEGRHILRGDHDDGDAQAVDSSAQRRRRP